MALADMAIGADAAIKQILLQRMQAQQYADTLKQRDFENRRQVAADARAQQQLDLQAESTRLLRERQQAEADGLKQQRTYAEATALGDQLPAGTFLPEDDAAVATMQQGGRGGLLTAQDAGMGTAFQGPLPTGETPQSVANNRPKGYLKTASAKQQNEQADNARADAKNAADEAYRQAALGIQRGQLDVARQKADRPESSAITPTAEANIVNRLTTQWDARSKTARDLDNQISMMEAGLNAARRGDLAQGAQAVLVTFQKVLDPTSVVRESEYMRSSAGQSLLNRIQGATERLQKGGAGVPLPELEKFAQLAREAAQAQQSHMQGVRQRIGKTADHYGIPHDLIFDDAVVGGPASESASLPVRTPPAPTAPRIIYDQNGKRVN